MSVEEYSTPMYLVMEGAKPVAIYIDKESAEKAIKRLIIKTVDNLVYKLKTDIMSWEEVFTEMGKVSGNYIIEKIPYRGNKNLYINNKTNF